MVVPFLLALLYEDVGFKQGRAEAMIAPAGLRRSISPLTVTVISVPAPLASESKSQSQSR